MTEMFKGLTKKKKTKKTKDGEKKEGGDKDDADDAGSPAVGDGEFDPSALKKKKKKKPTTKTGDAGDFEAKLAEAGVKEGDEDGADKATADATPGDEVGPQGQEGDLIKGTGIWAHDATAPISYGLLLNRFYTLLHSHHPDLASSGTKSYKIPPPQCLREGNKKTIFANISDICKRMKRSDEHVTQFLFAELGTSGSVDGNRRLVIRGRFQQKQIENVLRRYISMFCPSLSDSILFHLCICLSRITQFHLFLFSSSPLHAYNPPLLHSPFKTRNPLQQANNPGNSGIRHLQDLPLARHGAE